MKKVLLSWSSGKDSAWALHVLSQQKDVQVAGLVTTFNRAADRVAMHAVRRSLVRAQAERAGIPLWEIDLPWPCSNAEYEEIMRDVLKRALDEGIDAFAFGDLFLQDIRDYRERQLAGTGLEALFPIWSIPTRQLAVDMIAAGIKAKLTCVDPSKLDRSYAGRDFDPQFLENLPEGIDPCGENGEFHTFVHAAPVFDRPIEVQLGCIVERDGFVFADLISEVETTIRETARLVVVSSGSV
ncbi:MAG: adenine nucleotide alpha hydrolase [Acidobacteriota bacterium]|nr:adenine nucleotide alpha hydrolase [Acidobacteriota bacterium]